MTFSAALCRGLIEAASRSTWTYRDRPFSAALCRGLIEAGNGYTRTNTGETFSAALCRGLIEAGDADSARLITFAGFPRLYAAASLKQTHPFDVRGAVEPGFPRLYAAASLKHGLVPELAGRELVFSAALCRGLIEAPPRAVWCRWRGAVFRGFMPRPH